MALSETTTGWSSQAAARTGLTIARATFNGFCTAAVFGVISQKIRTTSEVIMVERSSPRLVEKRSASTVAIVEATITATLFTIRMVERNVLGCEIKRSTSIAILIVNNVAVIVASTMAT